MPRYQLQRRKKSGPYVELEDPAFRSRCISIASTGASRRTVAALVGKPEGTVRGWVNRGLAFPDVEPYGSFAKDYVRAERGIHGAIAGTAAKRVQVLSEMMDKRLAWEGREPLRPKPEAPRKPPKDCTQEERDLYDLESELHRKALNAWAVDYKAWTTPPPMPDVADMMWLERVRESRAPTDYGTSKHRQPELEHSAQEYLDAHQMDSEQLAALFSDPPDVIRGALVASATAVYAILLQGGFDPGKASDGSGRDSEGEPAVATVGGTADAPGGDQA